MESQKHALPWFGGWRRVLLTLILFAVFALLGPVLALGVVVPQYVVLILLALLLIAGHLGPACAVVCGALLAGSCALLYGFVGGACALILIVPVIAASAVAVERRLPFFVSVGLCTGVTFLSAGAALALITLSAHCDVATLLTGLFREGLDSIGEAADTLFYMLSQAGLVSLPSGVPEGALLQSMQMRAALDSLFEQVRQGATLSFAGGVQLGALLRTLRMVEQARWEMIETMTLTMDTAFRLQLPMMIATGSIAVGLFGQALARHGVNRRGEWAPCPPMREWLVPSGFGRILGGTYALFYVLMLTVGDRMTMLAYTFSGVFQEIFAIQGVAALCYLLHKHGKGRGLKALVFVLGYFLLRQAAVLVGIVDQSLDFTRRREALEGRTEDEAM